MGWTPWHHRARRHGGDGVVPRQPETRGTVSTTGWVSRHTLCPRARWQEDTSTCGLARPALRPGRCGMYVAQGWGGKGSQRPLLGRRRLTLGGFRLGLRFWAMPSSSFALTRSMEGREGREGVLLTSTGVCAMVSIDTGGCVCYGLADGLTNALSPWSTPCPFMNITPRLYNAGAKPRSAADVQYLRALE